MKKKEQWCSLLFQKIRWKDLDVNELKRGIETAKAEDMEGLGFVPPPSRTGDATSTALFDGKLRAQAELVARENIVLCGMPLLPLILESYDCDLSLTSEYTDGSRVKRGEVLARIEGPAPSLLSAERVALNYLQFLSGISTATHLYVEALGASPTRLLDTRKTHPGYRALAKYAVACGGGWNHRLGLYDRIMIKDNHLAFHQSTGGERLTLAIKAACEQRPDLPIEVEVDRMEQILPVLEAGADIILLDNFSNEELKEAVRLIQDRAWTEASGSIDLKRIPSIADIGLDFISTGATVHHSRWVDIGLDWDFG